MIGSSTQRYTRENSPCAHLEILLLLRNPPLPAPPWPQRADAVLGNFGRLAVSLWPPLRHRFVRILTRTREILNVELSPETLAPDLASGLLRFLARDYLLNTRDDSLALDLFDVEGADSLEEALAEGRGVVLVGSHLGGHIAAFHWLYRSGLPIRLMVQRPRHVASSLNALFDRDDPGADPQSAFFLRRGLNRVDSIKRFLSARAALRAGKAVYLAGDVPWTGPNTRTGRFLGQTRRLLSVWVDLAVLTRAPVFFVFCTHGAGGRHLLRFESIGKVASGGEDRAVVRYLNRLEVAIASHPADAAAHLLWPCYGPPSAATPGIIPARPS